MKLGHAEAALFVSLIVVLFVIVAACYARDLKQVKQLTGQTVTSLQTLKANCEKSLPRDKQCQLSVVASASDAKEDK